MKSRKIVGIILSVITVVSALFLIFCKRGMHLYGVIALILGILGSLFITFPESIFISLQKIRRNKIEIDVDTTLKREVLLTTITKIIGWIFVMIPIAFLFIRTI